MWFTYIKKEHESEDCETGEDKIIRSREAAYICAGNRKEALMQLSCEDRDGDSRVGCLWVEWDDGGGWSEKTKKLYMFEVKESDMEEMPLKEWRKADKKEWRGVYEKRDRKRYEELKKKYG